MSYIPEKNKYTLNEFKYQGGTDSLTYSYLWSPFAEYMLNFIPQWIAPNLITFSALLLLAFTHVIFMLPDQDNIVPPWKLIMMSVSTIIYQHLDNIDGKQARRTKTTSPLGMLFDHGSDAISTFLISSQFLKIFQLQYSFRIITLYSFIMSTYFCAMWSQYAVGYFKLGRINPVDEGLPVYAIACLILTQIDLTIFREHHIYGTYGQQVIYCLFFLLIFQVVFMTKDILKNSIHPKRQILFMPFLYILTGFALYILINTVTITEHIYHPLFYAIVAMWARNMILMQLQFITKQKYRIFNRGTNFLWIMLTIFIMFHDRLPISHFLYFVITAVIQWLILLQFVTSLLNEGSNILGIRIFSVRPLNKSK